jgi:hypothetical protein
MHSRWTLLALVALAACVAVGAVPTGPVSVQLAELHDHVGPLALIHADVLTMDNGATIERDRTVVVRDGRIVTVGPTEELVPWRMRGSWCDICPTRARRSWQAPTPVSLSSSQGARSMRSWRS